VKRKLLVPIALLTACIAAASWWYVKAGAAAGEFPAEALSLLPGDSAVVMYADMAALRGEPLVQRLAALAPAVQPGTEYAGFIAATGFQYERDLDRIVMSSSSTPWPQPQTPPSHFVAIADGRFDQKKIEAYAQRHGKTQQQNGHAVFTSTNTATGQTTAFTFLAPGRIAIANGDDLSAVLAQHPAATPDAALQEQISRVSGSPIFMIAKAQSIVPAAGRATGISTPLNGLRWVDLAARPDGDKVLLSLEGACDTPEQAKQIASTLELLRGLMRGMLNDPKNLGKAPPEAAQAVTQMLQTAQISSDAARVRLLVNMDTAKLLAAPAPAGR
jgi:hypothetical protein